MASENKHIIIGYLGNDPEIRYVDGPRGEQKVAMFTVATTERYKNSAGDYDTITDWHKCVAWRQSADYADKYLRKGAQVYIVGKVKTRDYPDKDTGKKVYITETLIDTIQCLDRKPESEGRTSGNTQQQRRKSTNTRSQSQSLPADELPDDDDDLPIG